MEIPCNPTPDCPMYGNCYTDTHHTYYPKRLYQDSISKIFRNLPENKVEICRNLHNEIHQTESPPMKPGRQEMIDAIGRVVMGNEYGEATVHRS
jgi:hypothetical protein